MTTPNCNYPLSGRNALVSLAILYIFHVVFLFILSEPIALLVRLNATDVLINGVFVTNVAVMSLSLPLSVRILSAVGYTDTKQIANIIPFISVICMLFISLPIAFDNMDASFLESVYNQSAFWNIFIREILLLAFIPTFLEGILWMLQIFALKQDNEGRRYVLVFGNFICNCSGKLKLKRNVSKFGSEMERFQRQQLWKGLNKKYELLLETVDEPTDLLYEDHLMGSYCGTRDRSSSFGHSKIRVACCCKSNCF